MRVQTRARGKRTRRVGPNARVCYHFLGSSSCFLLLVSCSSQFNHGPGIQRHRLLNRCSHVFMMPRPVFRVRTRPPPTRPFASPPLGRGHPPPFALLCHVFIPSSAASSPSSSPVSVVGWTRSCANAQD